MANRGYPTVDQPRHKFYFVDIASDYQFTELDNTECCRWLTVGVS